MEFVKQTNSTHKENEMTKTVRIENADTTSYKVRVRAQYKNENGDWTDAPPEEQPTALDYPAQMAQLMIHDHRRLIVEEYHA